jgi:hypothetical protein
LDPGHSNLRTILGKPYTGSGAQRYLMSGDVSRALQAIWDYISAEGIGFFGLLIVLAITPLLLYVFTIRGLFLGVQRSNLDKKMLILNIVIILIFIGSPGVVGNARFRVPVEPFFVMVASLAFLPNLGQKI